MTTSQPYLSNINALRGLAALLVVIFHGNEVVAPFIGVGTTFWFRNLYMMVDFFFILSGFIMSYIYESYFLDKTQKRKVFNFLKARLARIYPLHIITLGVCVFTVLITFSLGKYTYLGLGIFIDDFKAIPSHILLLQSAHLNKIFTWNVPSWSISAEWIAYLIFPFLIKPFSKFKVGSTVFALLLILFFYGILIYYISPNKNVLFPFLKTGFSLDLTYDWGFARGILGFTLGMCVYKLYISKALKNILSNGWSLIFLVIVYCIYSHLNYSDLGVPVFFSLILLSCAYGSKGIDFILKKSIFQKLGLWSYSIYMWHLVTSTVIYNIQVWKMQHAPIPGPPGAPNYFGLTSIPIILLLYLFIALVLGYFSYRFLEIPSRKWINNLFATRDSKKINFHQKIVINS